MEDYQIVILFLIAIISIVLGFIALLKQKIYLNPKTNAPVEIDVPILGKMKSNYPALVFVFLAFLLLVFIIQKSNDLNEESETRMNSLQDSIKKLQSKIETPKVEWVVTGKLSKENLDIDFDTYSVSVTPSSVKSFPNPNGSYKIIATLDKGVPFEEAIETISFDDKNWSAVISPKRDSALISSMTSTTRIYKSPKIEMFSKILSTTDRHD